MLRTRVRHLTAQTARWGTVALLASLFLSRGAMAAEIRGAQGQLSLGLLSVTKGEGFSDKQINTIEEVLLTAFEATGRFKVIGRTDISALMGLETKKEAVGCTEDTACVAQIAGALGVDLVATADVGRLGTTTIVTLKVIVVRTASALRRMRRTVKSNDELVGAADSMAAEIAEAVREVFGGSGTPPVPPPHVDSPPPPAAERAPEPPPSGGIVTSGGQAGTLHLQLGEKFKTAYTVSITSGGNELKCPIPLSPTNGCDLRPVTAGEVHYALLEGDTVSKQGTFKLLSDSAQLKLVNVRPGWATGVGIASIVVGSLLAAIGLIELGVGSVSPPTPDGLPSPAIGNGADLTIVGALLLGAGIPIFVAVHSPGFVSLSSSDPFIPAQ